MSSIHAIGRRILNPSPPSVEDDDGGRARGPHKGKAGTSSSNNSPTDGPSPRHLSKRRTSTGLIPPDSRRKSIPLALPRLGPSQVPHLPSPPVTDSSCSSPEPSTKYSPPSSAPIFSLDASTDDLYKSLSSFTFGAALNAPTPLPSPPKGGKAETISPLTAPNYDRTPRQSVSSPFLSGLGDHSPPFSTPKHQLQSARQGAPSTFTDRTTIGAQEPVHRPSEAQPKRTVNRSYDKLRDNGEQSSKMGKRRGSRPKATTGATSSSPTSPSSSEYEKFRAYTHLQRPADDDPTSDTASLHTFGPLHSMPPARSISSRSSSRSELRSKDDMFNSDADSDVAFDGDLGPVHGDEYGASSEPPLVEERRGSLPIAIPGSGSPGRHNRSRADFDQDPWSHGLSAPPLRKMSKSVDADIRRFDAASSGDFLSGEGTGNEPMSEPLSKADWRTLEAQMQERQAEASAADEFDLSYILNLPAGLGVKRSDVPGGGGEAWDSAQISASRRSSDALSYVQARYAQSKPGKGGFAFSWASRRPSAATIATSGSGEDPFEKFVKHHDSGFAERKITWSFRKEKADGPGLVNTPGLERGTSDAVRTPRASMVDSAGGLGLLPDRGKPKEKERTSRGMRPGTQEIWRCQHVGRFKVDRQTITHTDGSRLPQHRLNIRHIIDPYNKGNTRGGPGLLVHKHSRAVAFSLYRAYQMYIPGGRSHPSSRSGEAALAVTSARGKPAPPGRKPAVNILLAPRYVQEEFTSTRTTSKLNTYGLLGEAGSAVGARGSGRDGPKGRDKADKEKKKLKGDEKRMRREGEEEARKEQEQLISSARPSDVGSLTLAFDSRDQSPVSPSFMPVTQAEASVSTAEPTYPLDPSGADGLTLYSSRLRRPMAASDAALATRVSVDSRPSISARSAILPRSTRGFISQSPDGSDDSDDYRPPARTPHSEAFDSLDPKIVEYVRNKADHRPMEQASSSSLFSRFRKRLGHSNTRASSLFPPSPTTATLEGTYSPNWLTLATRNRQEQQERVLRNLSESFKDVGLLPSIKPSSAGPKKRSLRPKASVNIFDQVPDDALYMLLPLWVGETEPTVPLEDRLEHVVPLEDRKYLLVYYIPFDKPKPRVVKKKSRGKGKGLHSSSEESLRSVPAERGGQLTSFRSCARLVGYEEMRGSGIRLPSEGLAITGSVKEAMAYTPSQPIRTDYHDDVVIALCYGRDKGIELIPEGLAKLGLCMPVPEPEPNTEWNFEPESLLTPIGRAAAELTWLGGMALTSFGMD